MVAHPMHYLHNMNAIENLNEIKITKYLNFKNFSDFIENNHLYFRQVDKYEPYEGHLHEFMYKIAGAEQDRQNMRHSKKINRELRYISCWTLSGFEKIKMWKEYGKNDGDKNDGDKYGVAIQTTVSAIKEELELAPYKYCDETHTLIKGFAQLDSENGEIDYVNHNDIKDINKFNKDIFLLKNKIFHHEDEYRFIYNVIYPALAKRFGDSFFINVDTKKILKKILVAPNADELHFNNVKALLEKYGFDSNILNWSSLRLPAYNETDFK
jgi:hypothetical protein